MKRAGIWIAVASAAFVAGGCLAISGQRPQGRLASLDMFTYESEPYLPQTVTLIDTRDAQEIWSIDVPAGQKLIVRFYETRSGGTERNPDLMRWTLAEAGAGPRPLRNQMPVPDQTARRLDVDYRDAPEIATN